MIDAAAAPGNGPQQGGAGAPPAGEEALEREYRLNAPEEVVTFVLFWILSTIVFLQFFTRYVLNDSLTWTEEAARYVLIIITFIGSGIAVRRNSHIYLEIAYRYFPHAVAKLLAAAVDLGRVVMLGLMTYLCTVVADEMGFQRMNLIDMSVSVIYWIVAAGLAGATVRAAVFAWSRRRDDWMRAPVRAD